MPNSDKTTGGRADRSSIATQQPLVYDLYCGHGGVGLALDALDVRYVGVDIEDRSESYPGRFVRADASQPPLSERAALVWASPPCLAYSAISRCNYEDPKAVYPTIDELRVRDVAASLGAEYVIENVARCDDLQNPTRLNGLAFGAPYENERWFETSFPCPDALGAGEPTLTTNSRQPYADRYKPLAEAKGVPTSWGCKGVRSAIPREYVFWLLHHCPSVDAPKPEREQTMLTEMRA